MKYEHKSRDTVKQKNTFIAPRCKLCYCQVSKNLGLNQLGINATAKLSNE